MDAANANNLESQKKNEESLSYHSPNMSSEWQMNSTNMENSSVGLISQGNLMANSSSCSGAPMVDSFCSTIWDQHSNSQNLTFGDINVRQTASTSQSFGMSWNPSNALLKGGMFLPNVPGVLPQIPADSGFIERAARFSSFSGGNFGDTLNPFTIPEPMNPYFRGVTPIQRPQEMNMAPISKDVSLPDGHGATEVSPFKNDNKNDSLAGPSEIESDDAGCSGRGGQEELEGGGGESSAKVTGSRKRKRIGQDVDVDENKGAPEPSTEATKNQNPTSTTTKLGGRHGTQGPQTSDQTKEDYIHVRARRGQATNSHSLAERVRREKISERMKFLQDLVPGCSKVTGKAVMLDEIINYVQSLQRQVEFLSMKLATVNPRLNFNIESLLTKDILQSRAGPSSSLAFPPDMNMHYRELHPPPTGLMHAGLSGLESSSDALRRSICSQFTNIAGGYKEATSQVPNAWEDELHNVVQMGLNSISPLGSQDLSASLPPGHMKAEQ